MIIKDADFSGAIVPTKKYAYNSLAGNESNYGNTALPGTTAVNQWWTQIGSYGGKSIKGIRVCTTDTDADSWTIKIGKCTLSSTSITEITNISVNKDSSPRFIDVDFNAPIQLNDNEYIAIAIQGRNIKYISGISDASIKDQWKYLSGGLWKSLSGYCTFNPYWVE